MRENSDIVESSMEQSLEAGIFDVDISIFPIPSILSSGMYRSGWNPHEKLA